MTTTIQQTSKIIKLNIGLGASLALASLMTFIINQSPYAAALMGIGASWYLAAKITQWWKHA